MSRLRDVLVEAGETVTDAILTRRLRNNNTGLHFRGATNPVNGHPSFQFQQFTVDGVGKGYENPLWRGQGESTLTWLETDDIVSGLFPSLSKMFW